MPSALRRRRALSRRGRAGLLWGLVLFVSGQLALTALSERWRPELTEPEFGERLKRLRRLLRQEPGRPLVLALGSSRTAFGFRPDALPPCCGRDGEQAVAFNFSQLGGGPLMELLCLRRLLARGIHPHCVLVEVLCPFFHADGPLAEETLFRRRFYLADLPPLRRHVCDPASFFRDWLEMQLAPCSGRRDQLLARYAPRLLPRDAPARRELVGWRRRLDDAGWLCHPTLNPASCRAGLDLARRTFAAYLNHTDIAAGPDQALRELLELCGREGIAVLLFAAPEASELRNWPRGAAAGRQFRDYMDAISRDYGVPWVDARAWLADACFADGQHLLPEGARAFTQRLGREILQPLLAGQMRSRVRQNAGLLLARSTAR
jgi:hypothetical protein